MTKKCLSIILPVILLSNVIYAQSDEYTKFIQALLKGDTTLAMEIEKRNVTVEPIEEKSFPTRNIPEFIFHFGINQLTDTIATLFNFKNQYDNKFLKSVFYSESPGDDKSEESIRPILFKAETMKNALFSKAYFSKPNTRNDIYVHTFGDPWLSKLYFSKGKLLQMRTAFIIKLSAQDSHSTKISVVAESPTVINGISGFGVHGPIARETDVASSSIEEYSLLLFIADKLGNSKLEPLKLPNNN